MGFKPEDFFVGVIDFFAILLPGAVLSFVMIDFAHGHVFGNVLPSIRTEGQGWVLFAFSSYLLGHLSSWQVLTSIHSITSFGGGSYPKRRIVLICELRKSKKLIWAIVRASRS